MNKKSLQSNKEGSALIYVLCVLCIFMALILSMTLAAYQVLAHAQRAATKEQCRLSAITAGRLIEKQMTETAQADGVFTQNKLQEMFAGRIIDGAWPYYNEEEADHQKKETIQLYMEMDQAQENILGNISVTAYWESEQADMEAEPKDYSGINLVIRTTCTLRKQSFSVTTQYGLAQMEIGTDQTKPENWRFVVTWEG